MPYRKNVFVIGAGASVHCGAPIMTNFIETAREIMDSGRLDADEAIRFRRVFEYRAQNDGTEKNARVDLSNLEELFGLIDLHIRVEPKLYYLRLDLIFLIAKTLEKTIDIRKSGQQCQILYHDAGSNRWAERPRNITPFQNFVDIVARRWSPKPPGGIAEDTIISLNYDTLIERAMEAQETEPDYALAGFPSSPTPKRVIKLLKLHGSSNWAICAKGEHVQVSPSDTQVETIESMTCPHCEMAMEPFIVPPSWSKGNTVRFLRQFGRPHLRL